MNTKISNQGSFNSFNSFRKRKANAANEAHKLTKLLVLLLLLTGVPQSAAASSWNPTLLVNTESFQIIDEGDGTTDIEIRFGDTLNERLYWERTNTQFKLTDDLSVTGYLSGSILRIDGPGEVHGTLTASGAVRFDDNLTLNDDQTGADTVLTFGSDDTNETLTFENTADQFSFSDDVAVRGTMSGYELRAGVGGVNSSGAIVTQGTLSGASTITFSSLKGCDTIDTDINGVLVCGSDDAGAAANTFGTGNVLTIGDAQYVNQQGDTMTGNLIIGNAATLSVSGTIITETNLTINEDAGDVDAVLTFGNDGGSETATFSNTSNNFELSDDLWVNGGLSASGTFAVTGTTGFNGVTYTWPASTAASSGNVLSVNPTTGQLSWTSGTPGSGGIVFLKPEYPNAVYFSSGSSAVGTLVADIDTGSTLNFYRWATTNTSANQDYWISTQIRIPNNFRSWDPVAPIQFGYRGSGGTLDLRLLDTGDAIVPLTGASDLTTNSTTWATATVTGPETTGTYTADDYITLMVKMTSSGSGVLEEFADAGFIEFNWETKD